MGLKNLITFILLEAQRRSGPPPVKQLRRINPTKPEVRARLRDLRETFREAGVIS